MEYFLSLLAFIVAIAAFIRATSAFDRLKELNLALRDLTYRLDLRVKELEARLAKTKEGTAPSASGAPEESFAPPGAPATVTRLDERGYPIAEPVPAPVHPAPAVERPEPVPLPAAALLPVTEPAPAPAPVSETKPPVLPPPLPARAKPVAVPPDIGLAAAKVSASSFAPEPFHPVPPLPKPKPAINLEMFLGARLFAWLGGLAMFLGVIYGVRHAFQHDLIPPSLRAAFGFAVGLGLGVAGLLLHRKERYKVLAQSLTATGVLVLYGVSYASYAVYHFPFFNAATTFGLMSLITITAFVLSVRMNAQVVAILGMLGGFLTPPLCSTGEDRVFALFAYVALLDVGLVAVARHKRWFHLVPFAVLGTVVMQLGWMDSFFLKGGYQYGNLTWIVVGIFCGFTWLMTLAARWCLSRDENDLKVGGSALAMAGIAMLVAMAQMGHESVATRPVLLYTMVLLINAAVLYIAWMNRRFGWATGVIAALTFIHLACWTFQYVKIDSLIPALVIYFIFGVVHTVFSLLFVRRHGKGASVSWMPVITLLLILVPVFNLPAIPFAIWPAMLLSNLLVIGIAVMSRRAIPVLVALLLTLVSVFVFLQKLPLVAVSVWPFLGVLGLFAVVFVSAGLALLKRVEGSDPVAEWMPALSAALPFALLVMATVHLPVSDPTPIFGFSAALAVFLLILARRYVQPTLVLTALLCLLAVQFVWNESHYVTAQFGLAMVWHLALGALFVVYPLVTRPAWATHTLPWTSSALAMIGTFRLVVRVVQDRYPEFEMGLLPLAFAVIALGVLSWVWKNHEAAIPAKQSQLAWLGGTALFFITLIFPMQFHHQWLTIGWAFEGAALCWLYRRVPHPGLRYVAAGLLTVAFIRLGLNVDVLRYYVRNGIPFWNWFLYAYTLVAAAQFAAARMLAPPAHRLGVINLKGVFNTYGGLLLFILMNIEIADAYTAQTAEYISFEFRREIDLARDMTYTVSWGLFALALLVLGFRNRSKATRYAGMGLLGITLVKLFFHDLAGIDGIYRVGALMIVAVIAFVASWLYQRFAEAESQGPDIDPLAKDPPEK